MQSIAVLETVLDWDCIKFDVAIFSKRFAGLALVAAGMIALMACQSETDGPVTQSPPDTPTVSADQPTVAPTATSTPVPTPAPQPASSAPPELDRSIHSVELSDIVFDTFDGSSKRLSAASNALVDRLRDAIKPIYSAQYEDAGDGDWLGPDDVILGYVSDDGQAYAYPIKFLNFHELVNDLIDGIPVLITYCPLCASGVVFDRRVDGEVLVFGNTSALYNSDLVMFDHASGSYWFQTGGEAIVGPMTGTRLAPLASSMMTWGDWTALHPATRLLAREQGLGTRESQYLQDPFSTYGDYLNGGDDRYPFPVDTDLVSDALRPAEVVVAVAINGSERAYPPARIGDAAVNDVIGGEPVVVFSRGDGPIATVFSPVLEKDGRQLDFEFANGLFTDVQTGSVWNMAGAAISGELEGIRLTPLPSRRAFWFTISISNSDVEVYAR